MFPPYTACKIHGARSTVGHTTNNGQLIQQMLVQNQSARALAVRGGYLVGLGTEAVSVVVYRRTFTLQTPAGGSNAYA